MTGHARWGVVIAVAALGSAACQEPRTQFLVAIDTDAPAPRLVDRARIEVLVADASGSLVRACDECRRELSITESSEWPLSFGIPEELGEQVVVRVQLFPAGRVQGEQPFPGTTLERVVRLTHAEASGLDRRRIHLPFACAGIAADETTSCDARGERAAIEEAPTDDGSPSRVGSVEEGLDAPCAGAPTPDTGAFDVDVCVRGGAFWMGDIRGIGVGAYADGFPEHPALVRSFYMDVYEFTEGRVLGGSSVLPASNVSFDEATELCAAEGRRLPTEAEREWAASAGRLDRRFPWGNEHTSDCFQYANDYPGVGSDGPCPRPESGDFLPVGSLPRGATPEGIFDLVGNVTEWTSDRFERYDDGECWRPGAYELLAPTCPIRSPDDLIATRDGSFADGGPYWLPAAARRGRTRGRGSSMGFRCVRDAR